MDKIKTIFKYGQEIKFLITDENEYIQNTINKTDDFYELTMLEDIRARNKKGFIIDVGANIGNHTVYFSKFCDTQVYAFEPCAFTFDILSKNIKLNNIDNIQLFNTALGAEEYQGTVNIINQENLGMTQVIRDEHGKEVVDIRQLDSFFDKEEIGVIKIDVEGMELDVLRGAEKILTNHNPDLYIECQNPTIKLHIEMFLLKFGYSSYEEFNKTPTFLFIKDLDETRKNISINRKLSEVYEKVSWQLKNGKNLIDYNKRHENSFLSIQNDLSELDQKIDNELLPIVKQDNNKKKLDELLTFIKHSNSDEKLDELLTFIKHSNSNSDEKLDELLTFIKHNNSEVKLDTIISILSENMLEKKFDELLKKLDTNNPNDKIKKELLENTALLRRNFLTISELNQRLLKKLEHMYQSRSWKYTFLLRKLFNGFSKTETFDEYKNRIRYRYKLDSVLTEYLLKIERIENRVELLSLSFKSTSTKIQDNNKYSFERKFPSFKGSTTPNSIRIGIAAIPAREKALEKTIESLIDQADNIGVYLNGWEKVPSYLKHPKIEIVKSQGHGDIGDAGKFYWVDGHQGYYFTCDDDIVYPKDYISRIITKIKEYKFKAVIGWHGSLILEPFENYYSAQSRRVFAFGSNRPHDTPVHILGTGTVGFHTATLKVKLADFMKPNMADVFFGVLGQEQKIPFIVMKHKQKEMISIDEVQEDSINKHGIKDIESKKNTKVFQNQLVKKTNWLLNSTNKLSILLIGRFDTFTKGGIYKSNHLIKNSFLKLGHKVQSFDSQSEKFEIDKSLDIAIIYPGDPKRPDFTHAEEKMKIARKNGIPCCVNISYNTNKQRSQEIVDRILKYNEDKTLPPVYLMTFTDVAHSDCDLKEIQEYIIAFPKTIVGLNKELDILPGFFEREGIVLGDAIKLANSDITGGNIQPWIDACKQKMPHVKLYVFKQYGGDLPLKGVEVIPYMKDDFLEWISKRKLFVCLNEITTFEMTPTEAQFVGTPVVYRPMPQSLSEYIGKSGISVTTPEQFANMCFWLNEDEFAWNKYSKLSYNNAQSNAIENLDIGLETAIRKMI